MTMQAIITIAFNVILMGGLLFIHRMRKQDQARFEAECAREKAKFERLVANMTPEEKALHNL